MKLRIIGSCSGILLASNKCGWRLAAFLTRPFWGATPYEPFSGGNGSGSFHLANSIDAALSALLPPGVQDRKKGKIN
jgi:hypothetical protein